TVGAEGHSHGVAAVVVDDVATAMDDQRRTILGKRERHRDVPPGVGMAESNEVIGAWPPDNRLRRPGVPGSPCAGRLRGQCAAGINGYVAIAHHLGLR